MTRRVKSVDCPYCEGQHGTIAEAVGCGAAGGLEDAEDRAA